MQIVESHFEGKRSVVAVSDRSDKINEYISELKGAGQTNLTVKNIPFIKFPVYAVERYQDDELGRTSSYFEYLDEKKYIQLIKHQKQHKVEDNFHVYFWAYYFDEEHFQFTPDHDLTGNVDYVQVNNYFLDDEDAEKGLAYSRIERLAGRWDLEGLDKLYVKYMGSATSAEKEKLAYDGYLSLFSQMDYDFACGKLTDVGVSLLLPIAEKMSMLVEQMQWDVYSRAYMILLENAIANKDSKVEYYFNEAERAVQSNMLAVHEDQQENYQQLAILNNMLAEYRYFDDKSWYRALEFINTSIALDPAEGDWFLYLQLIHIPYEKRKSEKQEGQSEAEVQGRYAKWHKLRGSELIKFRALAMSFADKKYAVQLTIAMAFKRLREHMEWYKMDTSLFPEKDYLYWLGEAKKWQKQKTTRVQLTEIGHFFHNEGIFYSCVDLLETAISHFQRLIDQVGDASFEVYYKAMALEAISDIYFSENNDALGINYRNQATLCYKDHINLVEANASVFLHYIEYQERCLLHQSDIIKPSIEGLEALTVIAEDQSGGMYSSPVMLRVRLAVLKGNEEEVVFHVLRSLILFELSMEDQLKSLAQESEVKRFDNLQELLSDTFTFFDEVRGNYYLDTMIKWKQLKHMSPEEVFSTWEERKREIASREEINWG
ncbi:hypothetical protein JMN32_10185 [Fulvivirga sp. 29W222]|uniref:Uncharacterized protein n=1 Tax=Fulvivirga marina TaxID=2494733 RepID=A0A937G1B6_9BACT|nr:hypothetical protein [Fulvivirga marina]MBL6446681.1 hypothetical protein [Fulvivirga marina]